MKYLIFFLLLFFYGVQSFSQSKKLISGPWAGNVQIRTAVIWAEVSPAVKMVSVKFSSENKKNIHAVLYKGELGKDFNPIKIELTGLEMNTTYNYALILDGVEIDPGFAAKFTTQDLWQWRKPAPDFTFLTGSCAYFNEPEFDRPGKPYGGDIAIFKTMANTKAAFNLWLGDNWYYREADFGSRWALNYRASYDRSQKELQKFMAAMPQYAIWDDHDFGPNDAGKTFPLKNESREIFKNYWLNPGYGEDGKGTYTKISYSDVDFFLTDDRFFRSENLMPDSVNGIPSNAKHFFGPGQMEWLKNSLRLSKASFKIIAVGNQVLNPLDNYETMQSYSSEYRELINFITSQKIKGVLFFSGDKHHSEAVKIMQPGFYPLYDITFSPLTSGISKVSENEKDNPFRVKGSLIEEQNFGKITVSGVKDNRVMSIEFIRLNGKQAGQITINENELK